VVEVVAPHLGDAVAALVDDGAVAALVVVPPHLPRLEPLARPPEAAEPADERLGVLVVDVVVVAPRGERVDGA
jgi:hypothetical protein